MSELVKIEQLTAEQQENTVIVSGDVHPRLAEDVADRLGVEVVPLDTRQHPNTEEYVNILEPVRGKHVIAMQTHAPANGRSSNDALQQHLLIISAAAEASAEKITALSPNLYGARQDKKAYGKREPIAIKLTLKQLVAAGADRCLTVDIHSEQSLVAFDPGIAENIRALHIVLNGLRGIIPENELKDVIFTTPDEGGAKTVRRAAKKFGARALILDKERNEDDTQDVFHVGDEIIPGLEGRTIVFVEDMIDTAGTIMSARKRVVESGAGRVIAAATHPWFSGLAIERLLSSEMSDIIVTDTNPVADQVKPMFDKSRIAPNLTVVRSAELVSDALREVVGNGHLDAIYEDPRDSEPTR